jgi:hypothetical protein
MSSVGMNSDDSHWNAFYTAPNIEILTYNKISGLGHLAACMEVILTVTVKDVTSLTTKKSYYGAVHLNTTTFVQPK